jgi:hypothetical protein
MKRLNILYFALLLLLAVLFSVDTGLAQPQELTFNFTDGQQSFMVPNGVLSIHIQAWGAQGANELEGLGGLGGFAEGHLAVTPGQTLNIFVGGQGCLASSGIECGGFNGGGDANTQGGGGGASDVRVDGTSLNDRVIVAAGGGGACINVTSFGGNGGGLVGSKGGGGQKGQGGTQNSGGAGFNSPTCLDGEFGLGGNSTPSTCAGGGAGWFGGGAGCGGGGGSSYIEGVTNGNTTSGGREGDGLVVLSCEGEGSVVLPCIIEVVVTPIPTLSEWGLLAMAGILGIVGYMVIRRRKVSA